MNIDIGNLVWLLFLAGPIFFVAMRAHYLALGERVEFEKTESKITNVNHADRFVEERKVTVPEGRTDNFGYSIEHDDDGSGSSKKSTVAKGLNILNHVNNPEKLIGKFLK